MKVDVSKFENSSYRDCSLPLTVGELNELVPNYDKKTLEEDDDLESYNDSSNWHIEFN